MASDRPAPQARTPGRNPMAEADRQQLGGETTAPEAGLGPGGLLRLQRTAGNQAVASLMGHRPNRTGMPDALKAGIEALSGIPLDDARVHYDSEAPGKLSAMAYTQGTDIHLGPGQEQHLPHEAWHVVQQKQGRVAPTQQFFGRTGNADQQLELEADEHGALAASGTTMSAERAPLLPASAGRTSVIQRVRGTIGRGKDGKWQITAAGTPPVVYDIANYARLDGLLEAKVIKETGEEREFQADKPVKGKALITYESTDVVPEAEEGKENEQSKPVQLMAKFSSLPKNGEALMGGSDYSEAKECDDIVKKAGGWKYSSQLPICVLMHHNAAAIVKIIGGVAKDEQLDHLYALQRLAVEWGGGGTLMENVDQYVDKLSDLESYLKAGIENMKMLWPEMKSKEEKLAFGRMVMDSPKGYSWVIPDEGRWMGGDHGEAGAREVSPKDILAEYMQGASNSNPFTGANVHVDSIGAELAASYAKYKASDKNAVHGRLYSELMDKSGGTPKTMEAYVTKHRKDIVDALAKVVQSGDAEAITTGIEAIAKQYAAE